MLIEAFAIWPNKGQATLAIAGSNLTGVDNDRYRAVRRRLHDTQPAPGGLRAPYSRGVIFGLRKGLMIGTPRGKVGQLCGALKGGYRYYDTDGKRQSTTRVAWVSTHLYNKKEGPHSPAP